MAEFFIGLISIFALAAISGIIVNTAPISFFVIGISFIVIMLFSLRNQKNTTKSKNYTEQGNLKQQNKEDLSMTWNNSINGTKVEFLSEEQLLNEYHAKLNVSFLFKYLNNKKAKTPYDRQLRLHLLASGSKGNSAIVEDCLHNRLIVIDCGISAKQFFDRCELLGLDTLKIEAVLVTHEHSDHTNGLRVLFNKLKSQGCEPQLYINESCCELLGEKLASIESDLITPVNDLASLTIGNISVLPFRVPHDSVDCYGYRFDADCDSISYVSDIGSVSLRNMKIIKDSRILALEFNHDVDMLNNGSYPDFLISRISGRNGHLSNEDASVSLSLIKNDHLETLVCLHMSEKNNTSDLILEAIRNNVSNYSSINTVIASQNKPITID